MIETSTKQEVQSQNFEKEHGKPFLHKTFESYKKTDIGSMFTDKNTPKKTFKKTDQNPSVEFENFTKLEDQTLKTSLEIVLPKKYDDSKSLFEWNYRAKLFFVLFCIVFCSVLFLVIFNAVAIAKTKKENANLQSQIEIESELLNWVNKEYNYLSDEGVIKQKALSQGLSEIKEENIITFALNKKQEATTQKQKTNWFDKFCDFVFKLFGG